MTEPAPNTTLQFQDVTKSLIDELKIVAFKARECALEKRNTTSPPASESQDTPTLYTFGVKADETFRKFHDVCVLGVKLGQSIIGSFEGESTSDEKPGHKIGGETTSGIIESLRDTCEKTGKLVEEIVKLDNGSMIMEGFKREDGSRATFLYVLFQMMFETRDRECLGVSTLQKSLDVFVETWKTIKVEDLRGSESVKEVVKELREMIVQICIIGYALKPYDTTSSIGALDSPYMVNVNGDKELDISLQEQLDVLVKYMSEDCWEYDKLKALFDKNVIKAMINLRSTHNINDVLKGVTEGYQDVFMALVKAFNKNREMENYVWEWRMNGTSDLVENPSGVMRKFTAAREIVVGALGDVRKTAASVRSALEELLKNPELKCEGRSTKEDDADATLRCQRCVFTNLVNHVKQVILDDFLNTSRWKWAATANTSDEPPKIFSQALKLLLSNSEGGRGHYQHEILNAMFPEGQLQGFESPEAGTWDQLLRLEVPMYSGGSSPIVDPNPDTPYMDREVRITWDNEDGSGVKPKLWKWVVECEGEGAKAQV